MALVVKDRVQVSSSTTGTGTLTLGVALGGFQDFSVIGDGNTTYYAITNNGNWEVGIGTYTASGTTLSRDTVLESSNSGNKINLSGTSAVFCTYPAERSLSTDAIGVTVQAYDADTTKNDVANTFTANQVISVTDNTNAALRITQAGTGNALVVEDEANPDSSPFVIDANGNVGIGTSSPSVKLDVNGTVDATNLTRGGSQVYSRNNILGTVSQSSGVPTGAIIESGSNANGDYVKYADGTMICFETKASSAPNVAFGSIFQSNDLTWTFPAAFINDGYGQAINPTGSNTIWGTAISTSSTVMNFKIWRATTSASTYGVSLLAVGRWF
jgi:hypothetical protein